MAQSFKLCCCVTACLFALAFAATWTAAAPQAKAKGKANPKPQAAAPETRPSVADGYTSPTLVIPYARSKPNIDGVIDDREWQGASSINALLTTKRLVSYRQTRFWMAWDEDNIYVAMRSPLREGERIIQKNRDTAKDVNVVWDDAYEIWLDVDSHSTDGQPVFFQFLSNFAGARYDVMHEPAVGNSRLGYTANWNPQNRLTPDGKAWEMEVVIPRKSLFLDKPFEDGMVIHRLLARDYKYPWEQNSTEGTGSFSVHDSYSRCQLSKTAPAIHLLNVADAGAGTLGAELAVFGHDDTTLAWSIERDGGERQTGTIQVRKEQLVAGGPGVGLVKAADASEGNFRVRVTSADGKVEYLDWSGQQAFDVRAAKTRNLTQDVSLTLGFNPEADYVRATGDFVNFPQLAQLDRCDFEVLDTAGKVLAHQTFRPDGLAYVRGVIRLPELPFGDYVTKMRALDKGGAVLLEQEGKFIKKDHTQFPWWNTKAGNKDRVLPPWTPVTLSPDKQTAAVWGRQMTIGAAGLPAQITTQGQPILAAPAVLRARLADGRTLDSQEAGPLAVVSQKDWQVLANAAGKLGDLDISTRVTVEYDGMYKVEMTLTPRSSMQVADLKVIVPMTEQFGDYLHACGEGIRYGFHYGFLPRDRKGRIWDCYTVDGQPMVVGSFIPYVWIGSTAGGLCWFADSDQGWVPNNDVPAVEVRRDGQSVDLVLNLISSTTTLDAPRTVVFAFQASPVKSMHKGWRMDPWDTSDTFIGQKNYVYPDGTGSLIWQSLPFTIDTEACRKLIAERREGRTRYIPGGPAYEPSMVPYFEYNTIGPKALDVAYFGEAWKASSGPLYYGGKFQDYIIYNLDKWISECDIDGWYLDNVRPVYCDNIDAGRGYRLPDGRIQPTYEIFRHRDFFLRLRAVFAEHGKTGKIVNHMTNNMILPWNGAVDICYDGEHHVIYPEMGKDFMDFWSLERLRVDYPAQWGSMVNFMHEYQGTWEPQAKRKAMRAYQGMTILHDALPTGNHNGFHKDLMAGRERFGIAADDVEFIGYWTRNSGLSCETPDAKLAGWLRPGKLLVAAVNMGERADIAVRVDYQKLSLPSPDRCKAWDAETEEVLSIGHDGSLVVPVERHDYRQIIIEPRN